jgi:transcriptional regulator with XRE-family HTH domain
MKNLAKNLGENIKALRKRKGLTQEELAQQIGGTQKLVAAYENQYGYPSAEKIPLLAGALNVSLNELYGLGLAKQADKIKNPKLWKKFEQLEKLSDPEKRTVLKMIEGLVTQKQNGR